MSSVHVTIAALITELDSMFMQTWQTQDAQGSVLCSDSHARAWVAAVFVPPKDELLEVVTLQAPLALPELLSFPAAEPLGCGSASVTGSGV